VAPRDEDKALILHGRGRGCAEASHFTGWTLMPDTTKQSPVLIGTLDSAST
jgi:hypothetical protein